MRPPTIRHRSSIKAIGGQGDIALLTSQLTDPNTQLRIQAVKKAVEETNGKVKLVQTLADIDTPTAAPPAINALLAGQGASLAGAMATSYYPKNRIWPVPVWRRIGHFQWDDPGSIAHRRSPHR